MVISLNTHYARFSHFYARSPYEAKSAVRNGLWLTAFMVYVFSSLIQKYTYPGGCPGGRCLGGHVLGDSRCKCRGGGGVF